MANIPPLAGLAGYQEASRLGYSVEENVQRLLRYAWIEKRIMEVGLYWLAPTPEWEVKEAFGLHLNLAAEHASWIRKRVSEMRNPLPRMDIGPDREMDTFFEELLTADGTLEKLVSLYDVLYPALYAAYHSHYEHSSPVMDHPTRRMLRHILIDFEEILVWGKMAVQAVTEDDSEKQRADAWSKHLRAYLQAAGGIMGVEEKPSSLPEPRAKNAFKPDYFPRRDERFEMRWNFSNPQRQVSLNEDVPLGERTLALMCRRIVEMDVPEYMTRIIAEAQIEPWEYYVAMTRQLWDEVRHAMLGTIYFEQRGVDWKQLIAIHPGMAIRLGTMSVKEAHLVLYAIEQNLMPANTGKRLEYEISKNAGDALASRIQDYDWADEVLHVHSGKEWLLPKLKMSPKEAVAKGWELRASTAGVLSEYEERGEQRNWWPDFVLAVLGRPTDMPEFDLTRL
jgi:hypothetical protein